MAREILPNGPAMCTGHKILWGHKNCRSSTVISNLIPLCLLLIVTNHDVSVANYESNDEDHKPGRRYERSPEFEAVCMSVCVSVCTAF